LKTETLKIETLKIETLKIETMKFEISCHLRKGQSTKARRRGKTERKFRFYHLIMEIYNEEACYLLNSDRPQLNRYSAIQIYIYILGIEIDLQFIEF
jgi:hypothetical protein